MAAACEPRFLALPARPPLLSFLLSSAAGWEPWRLKPRFACWGAHQRDGCRLPVRAPPCRDLVKLPADSATPVVKPLPSFPLRDGDCVVPADALPHTLLLLDVQHASLPDGSSDASSGGDGSGDDGSGGAGSAGSNGGSQLYCCVRLEGAQPPAGPSPPSAASSQRSMSMSLALSGSVGAGVAAPLRTRALPPGEGGMVTWQERLIVALPMRSGGAGFRAAEGPGLVG